MSILISFEVLRIVCVERVSFIVLLFVLNQSRCVIEEGFEEGLIPRGVLGRSHKKGSD